MCRKKKQSFGVCVQKKVCLFLAKEKGGFVFSFHRKSSPELVHISAETNIKFCYPYTACLMNNNRYTVGVDKAFYFCALVIANSAIISFATIISGYKIPCSAKFSRVFNFANFANFQNVCKNISVKIFDTHHAVCACSKFAKIFLQKSLFTKISQNFDSIKFSATQ